MARAACLKDKSRGGESTTEQGGIPGWGPREKVVGNLWGPQVAQEWHRTGVCAAELSPHLPTQDTGTTPPHPFADTATDRPSDQAKVRVRPRVVENHSPTASWLCLGCSVLPLAWGG